MHVYIHILLPNIKQSAFDEASFSSLSDIQGCSSVGLGNISIYRQYHNTGVCNNQYCRHFHMSIISLMQYISEYSGTLQCSTIGLSTQSKYVSTILKIFSAVTHNTHVDDTKHYLNTLMQFQQ